MSTKDLAYQGPGATNRRESARDAEGDKDARWWLYDSNEARQAGMVDDLVHRVFKQQQWRREAYLRYLRLYSNAAIQGWGGKDKNQSAQPISQRLALNVVKSCCDAFTSKLTLERPKCTFLTSGGDWDLQERAKDLEKFVDGQFYEMHLYEMLPDIVLDSAIFGTGILKLYIDGKDDDQTIECERTPVWEFGVDEQDAQYGDPRGAIQKKYVDKLVLKEMFPEAAEDIERASLEEEPFPHFADNTSDMVSVYMCWHLKSGKKAEDGRYYIGIPGKRLYCGEYERDVFPFVFYRRNKAPTGFYGIGLAEELFGIQVEINTMLQKAQQHIRLLASGKWMVEASSKVSTGTIDNDISIVRYTGTAPQVYSPSQLLSADFYQHLDRLYARAFEICGISQLQASSQKPAGLNSGKALDTFADLASERFGVASHAYQDLVLHVAEHVIDLAREISETYPEFSVRSVSKDAMEPVKFLDTDLDSNEAVLQMYPTNKLSKDPAERIAQVEQLVNSGVVSPEDAPRLLDYPDLDSEWNMKYASFNLTMKCISSILRKGKMILPRPFMNLQQSIKIAQMQELLAEIKGAPEDKLQMLREWIQSAVDLANPPPAAGSPPVGSPSPPVPGAPAPMAPSGPPMPGGPMPPGAPSP